MCDGSGVLIKLLGCSNCAGNGFVHHFRRESDKHDLPFRVRCGLCVDCHKCRGKGAIDPDSVSQSLFSATAEPDLDAKQNFHTISNDLLVNATENNSICASSLENIHPHLRGILLRIERKIGKRKLEKRMLKYSIGLPLKMSKHSDESPLGLANQLSFNIDNNSHSLENITPVTPTDKSLENDLGPKFIQFRNIMNSTTVDDKDKLSDSKDFVSVVKADEHDIKSKVQRHSCPKCNGKTPLFYGKEKDGVILDLQNILKESM